MLRLCAMLCVGLAALTQPAPSPVPGGSWTSRANQFVAEARRSTLADAESRGIQLPPAFLAWVDKDPLRRAAVYGCRKDPLPVLLALRSLEIDLGEDVVRDRYEQLALAFAIQGSYMKRTPKAGGWNDADGAVPPDTLPDVSERAPMVLTIPGDPRVVVNTKDAQRTLDRDDHIINFLEDHQPALTAADVIASAGLQREFNAYMQTHGQTASIDCGDGAVAWNSIDAVSDGELRKRIATAHDLFHAAYRAKGRMPAERDAAPTPSESMAWLVRNDQMTVAPGAPAAGKWPRFPLNASWPVLMMLAADDQPLREREEIWGKFLATGEARTYGEYIGDIAQQFDMQSARRLSPFPFNYGSIQMMWKDGGVCGTMGNIGARTERILGVPASTAGQPGHCAMVRMEYDPKTGQYSCRGGQYASGGDEVTTVHAGWNYDDVGGRRPMVFHQSVAWGVNYDLESFIDTLVMRRAFDALSPADRADQADTFMTEGLKRNPYSIAVAEGAISAAVEPNAAIALLDSFNKALDTARIPADRKLYRDTVRDLAHAKVLALPASASPESSAKLLADITRQGCTNAQLLARCWRETTGEEGFVERCVEAAKAYLASADRNKNRKAADAFAKQVKAWAGTIKDKRVRAAWAKTVLAAFEGQESLAIRGKQQPDPAVAALRKAAGD